MATPITPKISQMVPTINRNVYEFADEIAKLSQVLQEEFSTRPEDYSELQIALLLRDRAKICRLINDDVPVGEIHAYSNQSGGWWNSFLPDEKPKRRRYPAIDSNINPES